jgi:sugar O-acyltransferase (sialic acid O-acetyltransferase NeuD family)
MNTKKLCIFGAGGFAKEAYTVAIAAGLRDEVECFMESDDIWGKRKVLGLEVKPMSFFNADIHKMFIAIGDPIARKKIADSLPDHTEFFTLIHPNVIISEWVEIGEGSIVCAGCILTCDIKIGKHAHINLDCTIGHDCRVGDFFTAAPSVNISGTCTIGDYVYLGTNSSLREKLTISDHVIVGMGGMVVKDIIEPGTYVGIPVKKIS